METQIVNFRCPLVYLDLIKKDCNEKKITISAYIIESVIQSIRSGVIQSKKDKRKIKLLEIREDNKMERYQYYILKNSIKRLMDYALSSYILTGKINIEIVSSEIKRIKKEYRYFEPKIKKDMKGEIKAIEGLNDIDNFNLFREKLSKLELRIKRKLLSVEEK